MIFRSYLCIIKVINCHHLHHFPSYKKLHVLSCLCLQLFAVREEYAEHVVSKWGGCAPSQKPPRTVEAIQACCITEASCHQ